jgi:hypothetical protein
MAPTSLYRGHEVIDLLSDSETEDEGLARDELDASQIWTTLSKMSAPNGRRAIASWLI